MKENSSAIYPGHKALNFEDVRRIDEQNKKNGYGITNCELLRLCRKHKGARIKGDIRTMERIEYRLTDINFHHECSMLNHGEYDSLMEELSK